MLTLPVILEIMDNLVHNGYIRKSLPLALADLLRVAAALGNEVVAIYPTIVSPIRAFSQSFILGNEACSHV